VPTDRGRCGRRRVGPTCHVLDWLHVAIRIHHVAQAVKGWPGVTADDRQDGARLADAVRHIRWRLWHGQVRRARDLIGDTLVVLGAMAAASSAAAAWHGEAPISTAPTEGTVQCLLHRHIARDAGPVVLI
jgi:hypothetical protein